jgi:hypothetical protein
MKQRPVHDARAVYQAMQRRPAVGYLLSEDVRISSIAISSPYSAVATASCTSTCNGYFDHPFLKNDTKQENS